MRRPTHVISLNCTVSDPTAWASVWRQFNVIAENVGIEGVVSDVNVSSEQIPAEDDETTFNEETLSKVHVALREAGIAEFQIEGLISSMQNYGILFRERL